MEYVVVVVVVAAAVAAVVAVRKRSANKTKPYSGERVVKDPNVKKEVE